MLIIVQKVQNFTIIVKDLVDNCSNNQSGLILLEHIKQALDKKELATISFETIPYVSTSFVNSAFINLLEDYSFDFIRQHLKFKHSTVQINNLIKDRFAFETKKSTVA
ncbi:STAS-like domain-containing protein [Streptococcus rifensis]